MTSTWNVPAAGPLAGVKVLEFGAIGPVPYAAMLLADMGADVVHIARPGRARDPAQEPLLRGRRLIVLDLKREEQQRIAFDLVKAADVLLEGNRPGVMERLGLGPEPSLAQNPRLIYGRMTGWGQDGPLRDTAGHDINYIALAGALHAIGPAGGAPVPALNLLGDYGGGGMLMAFGVAAALFETQRSGKGQVIDAAMVDGVASLMTQYCGMLRQGKWSPRRGENHFDGGTPWYAVYATADARHVAVGAIEEPFWMDLLARLELAPESLPARTDVNSWPAIRQALQSRFSERTRDAWTRHFAGSQACVTPVLDLGEVHEDPHVAARASFVLNGGHLEPAPVPRFSRTPGRIRPSRAGDDTTTEVLRDWSV